uniref:Uncharacterized protein n=1 Tax=Oryza brachyantha TaxID=4533 RepID=J3LNP9_ORYBR
MPLSTFLTFFLHPRQWMDTFSTTVCSCNNHDTHQQRTNRTPAIITHPNRPLPEKQKKRGQLLNLLRGGHRRRRRDRIL